MRLLLNELSKICKESPMAEKILIVPTHYAGAALLRSYTLKGYSCFNLRAATISEIASVNVQTALQKSGLSLLPGVLAEMKMQEVIRSLALNNQLSYFNRLEISPGVARIILSAVQELKESGHSPDSLHTESFVTTDKSKDIKKIYASYDRQLKEEKLIDRPDLLRMFLEAYTPETLAGATLLLPSNLRVSPLERKILSVILHHNRWEYLPFTFVKALKTPGDYFFERPPENVTVPQVTSHLGTVCHYDAPKAPSAGGAAESAAAETTAANAAKEDKPQVSFFHAYGETSEVREILRTVKREKINFEDVIVYYTTQEPYARLFFEEAVRCGIPVTFGEGISISCFRPGKLLAELIDWIRNDFAVEVLHRLIAGECFKYPSRDGFGKSAVACQLRSSTIGWGRERYRRWCDSLPDHPEAPESSDDPNAPAQPEAPANPAKVRQHKILGALKELLGELFHDIPAPDDAGLVDPARIAAALAAIIKNRSSIAGEGDARAYRAILDTLGAMASAAAPPEKTGPEEALAWIERAAAPLRVARSLPEPGSIHVDGYRNGAFISRKRVFVAGLDSRRFPGQGTEDPVLLDTERAALGKLRMLAHRPAENLSELVQLLAARESDKSCITLSFASYDTTENRDSSPSSLLLQVYRTISGETSANYSDFMEAMGASRGIVPDHPAQSLGASAWWMNRILKQKMHKDLKDKVRQIYPGLKRGTIAQEQRNSTAHTPYDGKLSVPGSLWEDGMRMSASKLEQLAECPYSYFLTSLLKIQPPDEILYITDQWLNPMDRGTLLHAIFEEFYREILKKGEKPSYELNLDLLLDIARKQIAAQTEKLPAPHRVVYDYECREILETCRYFLRAEQENLKNSTATPEYIELTFGIKGYENDRIAGEISPVKITLPSGRYFYLRGKIDRVDRLSPDGSYVVLDYKTGSTYGFEPLGAFNGGRHLQHALYGLALEHILAEKEPCGEAPHISACGYYFPTLKGRGQRIMRDYRMCQDNLCRILTYLQTIIDRGTFFMTDNYDADCKFCDYKIVCDIEHFPDAAKEKITSADDGPLAECREIRAID